MDRDSLWIHKKEQRPSMCSVQWYIFRTPILLPIRSSPPPPGRVLGDGASPVLGECEHLWRFKGLSLKWLTHTHTHTSETLMPWTPPTIAENCHPPAPSDFSVDMCIRWSVGNQRGVKTWEPALRALKPAQPSPETQLVPKNSHDATTENKHCPACVQPSGLPYWVCSLWVQQSAQFQVRKPMLKLGDKVKITEGILQLLVGHITIS